MGDILVSHLPLEDQCRHHYHGRSRQTRSPDPSRRSHQLTVENMKKLTTTPFVALTGLVALLCAGWVWGTGGASSPAWDGTTWSNPPASNPTGVIHGTYHSTVMRVDVGYNIYLPPQYASNPNAVYFLHSINGNENSTTFIDTQLQSMINATTTTAMIVVFPNAGRNSKYMDAQNNGASAYPGYMVQMTIVAELIPFIDATYHTIGTPESRAVQGFSMGGMGCELMMFKFPQLFGSAYCFAPANDDDGINVLMNEPAFALNMFNKDTNLFHANTAWALSTNNASAINGHSIHVTIGSLDDLLPSNRTMDNQLTSLGIAHDPLQIVRDCRHDLDCLESGVSYSNFAFASGHFH
jgi:enterochelin esterase-like enzyme